jgi:hypothetical protein
MALTIKNLKCGLVPAYPSSIAVVPTVAAGKSVLVDNITFLNNSGSSQSLILQFQNGVTSITVADNLPIAASARFVLEPMTLGAGQWINAWVNSGSGLDFVASGVEKDV